MTFEDLANSIHNERVKLYHDKWLKNKRSGEHIYLDFCLWCNANGKSKDKKNDKTFAEWLKSENITLTFWQRKYIAEKYFGWKFTWNEEKNEWESKRV